MDGGRNFTDPVSPEDLDVGMSSILEDAQDRAISEYFEEINEGSHPQVILLSRAIAMERAMYVVLAKNRYHINEQRVQDSIFDIVRYQVVTVTTLSEFTDAIIAEFNLKDYAVETHGPSDYFI